MILVIDVGNTTTQLGVFEDDKLIYEFRYITKIERTSDEIGALIKTFFDNVGIDMKKFEGVIISSVVPDMNYHLENGIKKYMHLNPIIVKAGIKTGINVRAENPSEVGADRIVDVAAAYHMYKKPTIVVNFGTATRFDYVAGNGDFGVAVTSPGIKISADALFGKASMLPNIEIKKPKSILASNSITSMQAGLVYGYIGHTEYIINKMKEEIGLDDIFVIASGGYGNIIFPETDTIDEFDPLLTLKGLKIIYDKNKR